MKYKITAPPLEALGLVKNMYIDKERTEISCKNWQKTYRKVSQKEIVRLIQDTTITQSSLIRLSGTYSTKMLENLPLNKNLISGIEHRPSKVFYGKELNLKQAINNDMLSYIPYSINYLSTMEEDTNNKVYLDNFTILNENLYFTIYLNKENLIETECMVLEQNDILTKKIQSLNNNKHLKVFITDEYNTRVAKNMLKEELDEPFVLITINKSFKVMYLSIHNDDTQVQFSKQNLLELTNIQQKYNDSELYDTVKEKYEFERKIIGKN